MKLFGILGFGGIVLALATPQSKQTTVIFSGDASGKLAPCGCTSPMIGGIKRKATVLNQLDKQTVWLENTALVANNSPQSALKAHAIAETMRDWPNAVAYLGDNEQQLGIGEIFALNDLSRGKFVRLSAPPNTVPDFREAGPFLVTGAHGGDRNLASFIDQALEKGLAPVVMLDGDEEAAISMARAFPALAAVEYRSQDAPPTTAKFEGTTLIATAGNQTRWLVQANWIDGKWSGYQVIALGPELADDPAAGRIYARYLAAVDKGGFLAQLPRSPTAPYGGAKACLPCHQKAVAVWNGSKHALSYTTISHEGHAHDPDCVSCHVTGLASTKGFRSPTATPQLAAVSCEQCHGPSLNHARNPLKFKARRSSKEACLKCHNPENSPRFDFSYYWHKIAH
ncbi:MAG: cytochrome c family protein [Armatimonadetes bacterium]|nr:cytochrome c family protein [Armatimonadota bacterium]